MAGVGEEAIGFAVRLVGESLGATDLAIGKWYTNVVRVVNNLGAVFVANNVKTALIALGSFGQVVDIMASM